MARALKFRTVIAGKTLTLADLESFVGKTVEVIVLEDEGDDAPSKCVPSTGVGRRRFGTLAGQLEVSEDFDEPLPPEIQRCFDGEGEA